MILSLDGAKETYIRLVHVVVLLSNRKRTRKKPAVLAVKEKAVVSGGSIDLESSGEFASVEKMLATTDANKFSTYLQTGSADLGAKRGRRRDTFRI